MENCCGSDELKYISEDSLLQNMGRSLSKCRISPEKYMYETNDPLLVPGRDSEGESDFKREITPTSRITLETINPDTIEFIPHKKKIIDAKVVDVYDGDTCTIIYEYGNEFLKTKIRVLGVDTPEKSVRGALNNTDIGDLEERAGEYVKESVVDLIGDKIIKVKMNKFDKYGGRINGIIYLPIGSGYITLKDYLVSKKYAKPYLGGKKEPWTSEELVYILNN